MADNKEILDCPACGKTMVKLYMDEQDVNLDVCLDGCGGIYFDNREFQKFDEKNEDISPLIEAYQNKTFKPQDETETRICPVCGMKMVKHDASAKHEIQVDECYQCGGMFLDYGELEKIRAEYETEAERAADAITKFYSFAGEELENIKSRHQDVINNPKIISRIYRLLHPLK